MPKILENPRERILEEGKRVLIESSYNDLNIRDIVKKCGIGIGTFYNYFKNKDELVTEIFMRDWKIIVSNAMNISKKDLCLKDKIYHIYIGIDDFLKNYMSIFYELTMIKGIDKKCTSHMDYIYREMEGILEFHKQKGDIKSELSLDKLARLIISNIITLSREKFLTFDELYESLNI